MTDKEQWDTIIGEISGQSIQASTKLNELVIAAEQVWVRAHVAGDLLTAMRESNRHSRRLQGALHCRNLGMTADKWLEDQKRYPITGGLDSYIRKMEGGAA